MTELEEELRITYRCLTLNNQDLYILDSREYDFFPITDDTKFKIVHKHSDHLGHEYIQHLSHLTTEDLESLYYDLHRILRK